MKPIATTTTYGIVSKGNGEAWLILEKHMSLATGGDKPDKDIRVYW